MSVKHKPTKVVLFLLVICLTAGKRSSFGNNVSWRDAQYQTVLENDTMRAHFQAGCLYRLENRITCKKLINVSLESLVSELPVFGSRKIDLDECHISQKQTGKTLVTNIKAANGTDLELKWTIESGSGDLILNASAKTSEPVDQFRIVLEGCKIDNHTMVTIGGYGVARPFKAPWQGGFGNTSKTDYARSLNHPLVALFQSDDQTGWFIEGRETRVGPANLGAQGKGDKAELIFVKGFPVESLTDSAMYEIRIRTYQKHWADAVDPYIKWMEKGAGFVPLSRNGHHPSWVKNIKAQSYFRVGDFSALDELAKRSDPARVVVGRNVGYRKYRMDYHYPNYEYSQSAKEWIRHARKLGFHVGAHFNISAVGKTQPELVKRFRDGFLVTGLDENGNEIYYGIPGPTRHYYCSPALKDWRDYFVAQLKEAVDAGIDVIYLDESMAVSGKYIVDGMTGVEGTFAMMEQIKKTYPGVAIETEQFNTLTAYRSDFALSQMPLGHPLSGYIFSNFIKILPEGVMTSPTDKVYAESFFHWAYMVPSLQIKRRESWFEIGNAYFKYDLFPDCRIPYDKPIAYKNHYTHGVIPDYGDMNDIRYFGLRGKGGVTAYYEKHGNKRGLVLYQQGRKARWLGARITGISQWSGPGAIKDWLVYNGDKIMALEPSRSYSFDESVVLPKDRFHITDIPEDFTLHYSGYLDDNLANYEGQEIGKDDAYFKIRFNGNGRLGLYVPDDYLLFINGQAISVDQDTRKATATISVNKISSEQKTELTSELVEGVDQMVTAAAFREINERGEDVTYSMLLAFRKNDTKLAGKWADLPWQVPPKQRSWHILQHQLYEATADGPALMLRKGTGFFNHVTGRGIIIGRFPDANVIRMEGAYRIRDNSYEGNIRGKVWINGKQVLTLPGSEKRPFEVQTFNVNISEFAGKHAIVEFGTEGQIRANIADWISPQFIVEGE